MNINKQQLMLNVDTPFLLEVLTKSLHIIKEGTLIIDNIDKYESGEIEYVTNTEGYSVLSDLETIIDIDFSCITNFFSANVTGHIDLTRRLRDFLGGYTEVLDVINDALEIYVPFTFTDLISLNNSLKKALGHLCIFVRKQFEFDVLLETNEVDFVLNAYLEHNGLTVEDAVKLSAFLLGKALEYRPRVAVFDSYPEYETPFFDIVGDEFYDMEYIDIKKVIDVIKGKITPEALLEEINSVKEK